MGATNMAKQHVRRSPLVYVEIEVSYRWRGDSPACAYLTVIEQRGSLHRRIVESEHVAGIGEGLIDRVNARYLELTREHVLTHIEPF
jgi:hypothetical protein